MPDRDLLLFTTSFPFGTVTESTFILAELPYLCKHFRRVIIVPENDKGDAVDLSGYDNVTVDTSRAHSIDHRHPLTKLRFALHPEVIRQGLRSLPHAALSKWPAAWSMAINRYRIARNLKNIVARHNIDYRNTVFYTFWFDHITEAVAMALPPHAGVLTSGAHGHDYMYNDTPTFRILPFRTFALRRMRRLYVASTYGADLMRNMHPEYRDRIFTRILGSLKLHPVISSPSTGENVTILSCARLVAYKRVELALYIIKRLAPAFPGKKFKYIHIGDGELKSHISALAANSCPDNLTIELINNMPNEMVHDLYRDTHIDWHILMSTQEGGNPIALSEALSYGVPVIACDVPGCREIADNSVGLLLTANPTAEEFITRITPYITGEADQSELRKAAFERWRTRFDASVLREKFASELSTMPSEC